MQGVGKLRRRVPSDMHGIGKLHACMRRGASSAASAAALCNNISSRSSRPAVGAAAAVAAANACSCGGRIRRISRISLMPELYLHARLPAGYILIYPFLPSGTHFHFTKVSPYFVLMSLHESRALLPEVNVESARARARAVVKPLHHDPGCGCAPQRKGDNAGPRPEESGQVRIQADHSTQPKYETTKLI
jgi:hypothetical protein